LCPRPEPEAVNSAKKQKIDVSTGFISFFSLFLAKDYACITGLK